MTKIAAIGAIALMGYWYHSNGPSVGAQDPSQQPHGVVTVSSIGALLQQLR
jgi:hypothetical protein